MTSPRLPALLALIGIVLAVGLFFVLKDDTADEDAELPPPATETRPGDRGEGGEQDEVLQAEPPPVVEIRDGEPVGGVQQIEFTSGGRAEFEVRSDVADELHFHGYDLYIDVGPGKATSVTFDAEIEGIFELESHTTGVVMAEISVVPS